MKKLTILLMLALFLGAASYSCKSTEQKGLTKEQRDRIDHDKKDFEKNLPDDD